MKRFFDHNIFHWLFVAGVSLVQDLTALMAGLLLVLVAFLIFVDFESDLVRISFCLPLLIVGAAVITVNTYGLVFALFSHRYSHNRCPFCDSPYQISDSEVKITCQKCKREFNLRGKSKTD